MNINLYNDSLFSFLYSSPTPFHAVANIEAHLLRQGFTALRENERWQLAKGCAYFLTREQGAIIAFILGSEESCEQGFRMLAAHTDSPCLQVKPHAEIKTSSYLQLGVEVYGGSLLAPWFDRDLSLAGRVCCRMSDGSLGVYLVNFRRPLLTIPSIAIHFDREVNKNSGINQQKHLPPILSQGIDRQFQDFNTLLLEQIQKEYQGAAIEETLSFDMFCFDSQQPSYTGVNNEFISSARLDNLLSCHAAMLALGKADRTKNILLFCANHEENGSTSASGAHGSFLDSVLERIASDPISRRIALSNSFLISMDNAHAAHPNFMEKIDATHEIHLNKGPVIKLNANQRYATNSLSAAIYKQICKEADIITQEFVMRSDLPCGSTIGPITAARLGIRTVDIGAASLAMHSIREHTGALDPFLLYRSIEQFQNSQTHRTLLS
ncbi:MAG: M18 family aminopeptidase [Desulfobulbaceae bacterium]|jgi:aspartyl aminopeptidase|nr:M18 family aminopeptidase [Desulfobulbaceae bacterium]